MHVVLSFIFIIKQEIGKYPYGLKYFFYKANAPNHGIGVNIYLIFIAVLLYQIGCTFFLCLVMLTEYEKRYEQFKLVFEEYYDALCNYAYNYTREKNTCEDIVQEVFLRIWEKRPDLIGSPAIRFYLFVSVRNNCLSWIEREKKSAIVNTEHMEAVNGIFPGEKGEDDSANRLATIQKGISLLPPKCKDVFLLSRIGNLSYKEIAQSLGISVKTVENQIGKALKILRDYLKANKPFVLLWITECFYGFSRSFVGDFMKRLFC